MEKLRSLLQEGNIVFDQLKSIFQPILWDAKSDVVCVEMVQQFRFVKKLILCYLADMVSLLKRIHRDSVARVGCTYVRGMRYVVSTERIDRRSNRSSTNIRL